MEFRVLQYFLAVAREQSISGAAESLHLTQPTLSTQLKALEAELGKQLLVRGTPGSRKVTLTEEGRILRISLTGSDDRFDGTVCRHGHVRCRRCGAVADIPWVEMGVPSDTAGYLLEGCAVEYRGLCPKCRAQLDAGRTAEKASL